MKNILFYVSYVFLLCFIFTTSGWSIVYPKEVLSPVMSELEIIVPGGQCSGKVWCFSQHKLGGHRPGGGMCQADDTYAWDANLNSPSWDFDAGQPVYAVERGVIEETYGGCTNAGGPHGQLLIKHEYLGNTWWSGYLHMSDIQVQPGQNVNKDTLIGYVSDVGADNNHLHFVVYKGSNTNEGLVSFNANIVPRNISWPMLGHDGQRTFRSPYTGPSNSNLKWSLPAYQPISGPVIDQYGTVYFQGTDCIYAVLPSGKLKWQYGFGNKNPIRFHALLIGPEGTIYAGTSGGQAETPHTIIAITSEGKLKWETEIKYAHGAPYLLLANNTLYYSDVFLINDEFSRPFLVAFNIDTGGINWVFDLDQALKFSNFDDESIPKTSIPISSSIPALSSNSNIYIGFENSLFFIGSQGNLLWKKAFDQYVVYEENSYASQITSLAIDEDGSIYLLLENTHVIGGCWGNIVYGASLFKIDPNLIDPSSTEISQEEIKWKQDVGYSGNSFNPSYIIIGQNNLHVGTTYPGSQCYPVYYLCSFTKDGQPFFPLMEKDFFPWLIDANGNLYGHKNSYSTSVIALDQNGNELWRFPSLEQKWFLYPFALSSDSTLYAVSTNRLYAVGPSPENWEPDQPFNIAPVDGATGLTLTPTLESSPFSDLDSGDIHIASQWQITITSGDYSNPVFDSGTDTQNLTNITSSLPSFNSAYYWHVRYQDNHENWSEWSAETSFTTASISLLEMYAPVLYFHPEEQFYPWGINSMLDKAELWEKKILGKKKIADPPIAISKLMKNNTEDHYLDLQGYDVDILPIKEVWSGYNEYYVYGRMYEDEENYPDEIILQYWIFYPFNSWQAFDNHEGDWEKIQIQYSKKWGPKIITSSHHHSVSIEPWVNISKVEETHPKIFVALGGHGNWFDNDQHGLHYVGDLCKGINPLYDTTSEEGFILCPKNPILSMPEKTDEYNLIDITDNDSWPYWVGRWGNAGVSRWWEKGSKGLSLQDVWWEPFEWGNIPRFWACLGSPAHLHAYDFHGNHMGLTEMGEIEATIPGAEFYLNFSDNGATRESIWISTSEELRFVIKAISSGSFNFNFGIYSQEKNTKIQVGYKDVQISENTIAVVDLTKENPNFIMEIDFDGDGVIDKYLHPTEATRVIPLKIGWNLISFPADKYYYEGNKPNNHPLCIKPVNINELDFNALSIWFGSIITPSDAWQMVIGADGAMDSSLPSTFHSLKYMSPCSGYWVKITQGLSPGSGPEGKSQYVNRLDYKRECKGKAQGYS